MTKASRSIILLLFAMFFAPNLSARDSAVKFGSLDPYMTFAEMRAALPRADWKSREFEHWGILFTRAIYANDAVDWAGRRFNIVYERTGYPSAQLSLTIELPQTQQSECADALASLSDDVAKELGISAGQWNDNPPTGFGLAASLYDGFVPYAETGSNFFHAQPDSFPEAQKRSGWLKTPAGGKLAMANIGLPAISDKATIWRGFVMQGDVLLRFFGRHGAKLNREGKPACIACITMKRSREVGEDNPPIVRVDANWEGAFTDAEKLILSETALPSPAEGAKYYFCRVRLKTGEPVDCYADKYWSKQGMPFDPLLADDFGRFITRYVKVPLSLGEDDFAERQLYFPASAVQVAARSQFDWTQATGSAVSAGVNGVRLDRIWGRLEYPIGANGDFEIAFLCHVMEDLSVYCGETETLPAEFSRYAPRMHKRVAGLMSRIHVDDELADGGNPRGRYFRITTKFRMPQ